MKPHFTTYLSVSLCLLAAVGFTQLPTTSDTTAYTVVEHSPSFPGGYGAMKAYLQKNVQYSPEAQKAGIKDRVFTTFVVEIDGSITNVQILKGIGSGCDEETVRLIRSMPRWIPGSESGKPLRVRLYLPVLFGMDYPKPKKY